MVLWLQWPEVDAGLCQEVASRYSFIEADRQPSRYFNDYFIKQLNGVYYIFARKQVRLDYDIATRVMNDLESHPSFIPGYQSIEVVRQRSGEMLTAIRFRAAFSPLTSRFTNRVEILQTQDGYQQCWKQLQADDPRLLETPVHAPGVNLGYWRFDRQSGSMVDIQYFSMLQPPLPLPAWLYSRIVAGQYEGLFDRIIEHILEVTVTDPTGPQALDRRRDG